MKSRSLIGPAFLLLAAAPVAAQVAVEYGLGAARAVTKTAPARDLGKQMGGVWDGLNKTLKAGEDQPAPPVKSSSSSKSSTTAARAGRKTASNTASPAPLTYEDARHIEAGIGYEELVRRFGPPSMEFTMRPGDRTLSYAAREGTVGVEVENDKVVTVTGGTPPSAPPAQ